MRSFSRHFGPGLKEGALSALLHFSNEVICFYALGRIVGDSDFLWLIAFLYDALAFLPQSLIAALIERFPRLPLGGIGSILLCIGLLPLSLRSGAELPALVCLSLGNACVHVALAEKTLAASPGKLSPAALYVGAGAFGVITGRTLAANSCPLWPILCICLLLFVTFLLWEIKPYKAVLENTSLWEKRFRSSSCSDASVLLLSTAVVAVRAYMGGLIPTEWNRSSLTAVFLFVSMGLGKIMGGFLADLIGCRKTAFLSIVLALPFLILGRRIMAVSLIGILLFSMTMPLTLGAALSVLSEHPGVAFGLTTIGLFLGTLPSFFFRIEGFLPNVLLITALSVFCFFACSAFLPKDEQHNTIH